MTLLRKLLVWLFGPSLDTLLSRARAFGSVLIQDEAGAGWYCQITPSTSDLHAGRNRQINSWSGRKATARDAVIEALDEAASIPIARFHDVPNAPKLGGKEFD